MSISCPSVSHFCTKIASIPSRIHKVSPSLNEYVNFPVKTVNRLSAPIAQKVVSFAVRMGGECYVNYCQGRALSLAQAALPNAGENAQLAAANKIIKPLIANIDRAFAEKGLQIGASGAAGYAAWAGIAACPWLSAASKISNLTNLSLLPARAIVLNAAAWVTGPAVQKGVELATNNKDARLAQYKEAIIGANPELLKEAGEMEKGVKGKEIFDLLVQSTLEKYSYKIALLGSEDSVIQKIANLKA